MQGISPLGEGTLASDTKTGIYIINILFECNRFNQVYISNDNLYHWQGKLY